MNKVDNYLDDGIKTTTEYCCVSEVLPGECKLVEKICNYDSPSLQKQYVIDQLEKYINPCFICIIIVMICEIIGLIFTCCMCKKEDTSKIQAY